MDPVTAFARILEHMRLIASRIPGVSALAEEAFLFRPFILLLVLGIAAGAVGALVNLRRVEFNAEAMVHSVFPGIVAGFAFGGTDTILPGAALAAVLVVAALALVEHTEAHHEGGTAVILTSFFGFGIALSLKKGDMSGQLEALMFGRLLEVTDTRLAQSLLVCLLALLLVAATWKENVLVAHDREGARAMGVKLLAVDLALNGAIAAIVVSASAAVGVLLVIAYLVVPGAAGRLVSTTVAGMCAASITVAVLGGWIGMRVMLLPAPHPVSPQAAVVLSIIGIFILIVAAARIRDAISRRGETINRRRKAGEEPLLRARGAVSR